MYIYRAYNDTSYIDTGNLKLVMRRIMDNTRLSSVNAVI